MRLKEPLNFAGRLYDAGESVKGKLPLDMIEALRRNQKLEEDPTDSETPNGGNDEAGLPIAGGIVISVSDFAEKTAPEQKDYLKALQIDPAGKEEDRIAQYEEWYAEQVIKDENDL